MALPKGPGVGQVVFLSGRHYFLQNTVEVERGEMEQKKGKEWAVDELIWSCPGRGQNW